MVTSSKQTTNTLDSKYTQTSGWVYLSGNQALVRLAIQQRLRDAHAGHNTAAYVSGYRGSPLGRFDMEMWHAKPTLEEHHIHFRAAVNEDLAATALWGSQYVGAFAGAKVDGVFGLWYGKGPGVDRCGDVLRHANSAGTSKLGGVLVLAGDDHGAKSSTITNFSDQILIAAGIPVLFPSNTQELLDYGLHGIAMSRMSGCWVGMKVVTDVVEGGGTICVDLDSPPISTPQFGVPADLGAAGLHARAVDNALSQEDRLYNHKHRAVMAYARANHLNQVTQSCATAKLGILSAGKAYQDLRQAMSDLGLDDAQLQTLGVRIAKMGMVWPLDPEFVRDFCVGLDTLLVIEEKRPLIEEQCKAALYDWQSVQKPKVLGKFQGASLHAADAGLGVMPNVGEVSPSVIAKVLVELLGLQAPHCALHAAEPVASGLASGAAAHQTNLAPVRAPTFCSGCPHNRSTQLPDGSRALAGIGCHTIAMLQNPLKTTTVSHMGGEGVMWLGQQAFTHEKHVFANMGDGTYFHSGFLAIRQAIAAHVPMTYKILFNGFVSMTGGQPVDGDLTVASMAQELLAEGAREVVVVSDEPEKYRNNPQAALPAQVKLYHRSELDAVQRRLREIADVTILIYEQPCATERRRLRKRGKWSDPPKRSFINAAVCEGCGDCGKASNCMSIEPFETALGRKRRINQSSCNKDLTCVEGFCPSFVTVLGGQLKASALAAQRANEESNWPPLPEPTLPDVTSRAYSVLMTGIGGTGVVTLGQTLGMAAHLDGLRCTALDVTGLAQKYGAVMSHVRIAQDVKHLGTNRISQGEADVVIACDLIVTAGSECMNTLSPQRTRVALCTDLVPTTEFTRNSDWQIDASKLIARIKEKSLGAVDDEQIFMSQALALARELLGDALAANMFMLGAAWQKGWVPVSLHSLARAIELNAVQVTLNLRSFEWGRRAACDLERVKRAAEPNAPTAHASRANDARTLEAIMAHRSGLLQNYATGRRGQQLVARFQSLVSRVWAQEQKFSNRQTLSCAVARQYFRLLASKDEWEVARLYAAPEFAAALRETFDGDYRLHFHLGAWPFAKTDAVTGRTTKAELGSWVLPVFKLMSQWRGLRGTWLDPFKRTKERRLDQQLLTQYESDVQMILENLNAKNYSSTLDLAMWPEQVKGYGHVRAQAAKESRAKRAILAQKIKE